MKNTSIPTSTRVPAGRLRPERDTLGARRRLLLVTVLARLVHLPRTQRTAKAIAPISNELAPSFGLRTGLTAKSFQRDDALDAIYQRARFGRETLDATAPSVTAVARAAIRSEKELRSIIKAQDAELREARAFNVVACVREFRKQIGR